MNATRSDAGVSRAHEAIVAELYARTSHTVDELPYTDEFDQLYATFLERSGSQISKHAFWRALANARKAGRLARKVR